jgi:hypothetical protein
MNSKMWKQIIGFEYEVSESGDIRSIAYKRILVPSVDKYGYRQIGIRKRGDRKKYWFRVHRLVGIAFCNPPENFGEMDIDHIDRNPSNNSYLNLRWTTRTENNANRKDTCWSTNTTTGQLYVTKYRNGYMLRINRSSLKHRSWHKTLEDAVHMRESVCEKEGRGQCGHIV